MKPTNLNNFTCPLPMNQYPKVVMAHGGGGKLMNRLIQDLFRTAFGNADEPAHDSFTAILSTKKLAFTTDSHVVQPLFFPGGDIGSLSVYGTVNDLAMSGAKPLYLSAGFILEEGLDIETLWKIAVSMKAAADNAQVQIVTGDTKVVEKGKGDGVFINTAGIGIIEHDLSITPQSVQPSDAIILSGDIGRHGMAVMSARENLQFETQITSDCASLSPIIQDLLHHNIQLHCLRDLTRGGLASALNEIASASGINMQLDENSIPVRDDVSAACEMLGFDPLYVANEGRFVAFVPVEDAEKTLTILRSHADSENAAIIGYASDNEDRTDNIAEVVLKTRIGSQRIVDMLSGEQLPRIC